MGLELVWTVDTKAVTFWNKQLELFFNILFLGLLCALLTESFASSSDKAKTIRNVRIVLETVFIEHVQRLMLLHSNNNNNREKLKFPL